MPSLTTLARAKRYFAITTSTQDVLIDELIPRASRQISVYCSRAFPTVARVGKRLNGTGSRALVLPDQPILSIQTLTVDGKAVAASGDGVAPGYVNDETSIVLIGGTFTRGRLNVVASWRAGYEGAETVLIPGGNTPTVTPEAYGLAAEITSVVRADNAAAFVAVASGPIAGQYAFADGVVTFAAADAGVSVLITYGFIPADIEQACIEMVGLDIKQRDNIGVQSKSMAGESVSYTDKGLSVSVKEALRPYCRKAPA